MSPRPPLEHLRPALLVAATSAAALLGGCAVVSVAGTAVSVGASAVGLAAGAAVGTARLTGKAAGAAMDAFSDSEDDGSGLNVRFREPTSADRAKRQAAEQQAREYDPAQPDAQQAQRDAGLLPPLDDRRASPQPVR